MRPVVAILDTGIDTKHKIFNDICITQYTYDSVNSDWNSIDQISSNSDLAGHGTAVASIIAKYSHNVQMVSFQVFNENEDEVSIERLISALNFIENNITCHVINMSLGVAFDSQRLRDACIKLNQKGTVLVSAFSNNGEVSYPASYDCVIGVDSTTALPKFGDHIYVENSIVNIGVKRGNQRVAWPNQSFNIVCGNSFATPLITAKVLNYISSGLPTYMVQNKLKADAVRIVEGPPYIDYEAPHWLTDIKNVAVFPYNKETKSLIRFAEMLPFNIVHIYDAKYSGMLGINAREDGYAIEDIENCDYSNIDTFIIGHVDSLEQLVSKKYKNRITEQCMNHGIKVVSFDNDEIDISNPNIYTPYINRSKYTCNKFGKLYTIKAPVLAVAGTSEQQGKFTLQLMLRKMFLRDGYDVAQLSSEPEGLLFGMDNVYAYGHNSNIELNSVETIEHVNALIHQMDIKGPDIIITGSQSGTTVLSFENTLMYNIPSMCFWLGANPDAAVLCVNYHDTVSDIKRAIKFIESLNDCKVIALSLFPLAYIDEWDYVRNKKNEVQYEELLRQADFIYKNTGIKTFVQNDSEDIVALYNEIIEFFSAGNDH